MHFLLLSLKTFETFILHYLITFRKSRPFDSMYFFNYRYSRTFQDTKINNNIAMNDTNMQTQQALSNSKTSNKDSVECLLRECLHLPKVYLCGNLSQ